MSQNLPAQNGSVTVVVADATRMDCQLLVSAIERMKNYRVQASATTTVDALAAVRKSQPDIALLSVRLEDGPRAGLVALHQLRSLQLQSRLVMMVDAEDPELVVSAFREGARGVFCRSGASSELRECMQSVLRGKIWANSIHWEWIVTALGNARLTRAAQVPIAQALSKREQEVARLVAAAMSNRELSKKLNLSEHTIKNYLSRIFEKLTISTRTELVLYVLSQAKRNDPRRTSQSLNTANVKSA